MKKLFTILCICALAVTCTACNNQNDDVKDPATDIVDPDNNGGEVELPDDIVPPENQEFSADIVGEVSQDMQELVKQITTESQSFARMGFETVIEADRAAEFIGLTKEEFEANVVDSVVYESQISPSTQSLCIIKLNDTANKETLMQNILEKSNPMKWVCMGAEYVLVSDNGSYVMLAMNTKENCEAMNTSFTGMFEKENTKTLTKVGMAAE